MKQKLIVLALGGNALASDNFSPEEQYRKIEITCKQITTLIERGYKIVITHGNGPQVGFALRKAELASREIPVMSLDDCVAETQGSLGTLLTRALVSELQKKDIKKNIATLISHVLIEPHDPAFDNPTKPIGDFLTKDEAQKFHKKNGWAMKEDAGRGFRRVVPSPAPQEIIELDVIKTLLKNNTIVITLGGGGIPIISKNKKLQGIEAVIDKDASSSLLAQKINADIFLIITGVSKVYINYRKDNERGLDKISSRELEKYLHEGHFASGSMRPKIHAVLEYVKTTNGKAIITDMKSCLMAFEGKEGTHITKK